jgi:hypothetical protein
MPLSCFDSCPLARCPRFFRCEEHWGEDELKEMAEPPLQCNENRPDWVEPQLKEPGNGA